MNLIKYWAGGLSELRVYISVEDLDLFLRLSQIGETRFINNILGTYSTDHNYSPISKKLSFYISNVILREHHVNLWVRQHPEEKYIFAIFLVKIYSKMMIQLLKRLRWS